MAAQTAWWTLAAASAALGVVSALADWKRTRRRDLDRPGWVPWTGLQILALLVAVVAAVLALRA
jgi:hypothetical protein